METKEKIKIISLMCGLMTLLALLYVYSQPLFMTALLMVGGVGFLPLGFVLGYKAGDLFIRCKMLRMITGKNYAVVYLVDKGKNMSSFITNLSAGEIWKGENVWHVYNQSVYREGRDNNVIPSSIKKINAKDIHYSSDVPVLFLDVADMQPLFFSHLTIEEMQIAPNEMGSALKGWTYNQLAKSLYFKQRMEMVMVIVVAAAMVAAYYGYQTNMNVEEIKIAMQAVKAVKANTV